MIRLINEHTKIIGKEHIPIAEAFDRVSATDIKSTGSIPSFSNSPVDGYACKSLEAKKLKKIGSVVAGSKPSKSLNEGECYFVKAGAMLPVGTEVFVPLSIASEENEIVSIDKIPEESFIRSEGSVIQKGDILISKGKSFTHKHIAMLALLGLNEVEVFKTPKVGFFAVGNNLINMDKEPLSSEIRNCTPVLLKSFFKELNVDATNYGIVADSRQEVRDAINKARKKEDLIIICSNSASFSSNAVIGSNDCGFSFVEQAEANELCRFGISKSDDSCFVISNNIDNLLYCFKSVIKTYVYRTTGFDA